MDIFNRFQGKPAGIIEVYRVADQNALHVASTVKGYIEKIRPSLPEGVDISYFGDRSKILKSRIRLLLKNMALGLVLVSILLGLFLNRRLAFWVTLGIPISFMAGLMLLPRFDVSINMVSLFAFIMVLGIVVDDAIVVGENVFRRHEEGAEPLDGAVRGTLEVGRPVIFAVLTTVAAFWPLLLGSGTMGTPRGVQIPSKAQHGAKAHVQMAEMVHQTPLCQGSRFLCKVALCHSFSGYSSIIDHRGSVESRVDQIHLVSEG